MKDINSYEKDGGYEDEEGLYWRSLTDLLQGSILKFCCCGSPENNLMLIHDLLMKHQCQRAATKDLAFDERWKLYADHKEELKNFVCERWDEFLNFFWYVMNEKNIMTHGGSIPGWIDNENFMNALKKWKTEYKENEDE